MAMNADRTLLNRLAGSNLASSKSFDRLVFWFKSFEWTENGKIEKERERINKKQIRNQLKEKLLKRLIEAS